MRTFVWNNEKNELLKRNRNVSFEEIVFCIENGGLLKTMRHPNPQKYPNQKIFLVEMKEYVFIVPFVEENEAYFLKTIYPSRKHTNRYLKMIEPEKKAFEFLDKEEKELMESIENDEWIPVENQEQYSKSAIEASKNTFKKTKRVNIRMSEKDFYDIQIKAIEEGIPYQTLISSIIHKYNSGKLKAR